VLDAGFKIPSNLAGFNLKAMGDMTECVGIHAQSFNKYTNKMQEFNGKYCRLILPLKIPQVVHILDQGVRIFSGDAFMFFLRRNTSICPFLSILKIQSFVVVSFIRATLWLSFFTNFGCVGFLF
jgi:hypothetical protein